MKPKRLLMATLLSLSASAGALWAQDFQARIIAELQDQGYLHIEVSRTWLGRIHIEAEGQGREREIIFNPTTGEILRDYWEIDDDEDDDRGGSVLPFFGSGHDENDGGENDDGGGHGRDDDDDDDGGHDDDDD